MARSDSTTTTGFILGGMAVIAAAAVGFDYFINGPDSILGRLREGDARARRKEPTYRSDQPPAGQPSTSPYEVPTPTLHDEPLPEPIRENTASSGALLVPVTYKRPVKSGLTDDDLKTAAEEIARQVHDDVDLYGPDVQDRFFRARETILDVLRSPYPPEIWLKLAKFHADHGHNIYRAGSPLIQQQLKLVGSSADFYERMAGIEPMFSRTDDLNANAREYDDQDDRLAATGAESPIFFRVQNAWPAQDGG